MRWLGPFQTANVAAMEMACLCLLALAVAVWCFRRQLNKRLWIGLGIIAMLLCVTAMGFLVATGSRAGTLSALLGFGVLSVVRQVPWRITIILQVVLLIATLCAPFQTRYTEIHKDSSALFRVTLAISALSMMYDHPNGLGDQAQQIFLDWYMPASEKRYNIATTLNDATTCAIRSGVPTLAIYVTLIAVIFMIGLQHAWRTCLIPTLGILILFTHIIGGQFQAHLFTGWFIVEFMWGLGLLLCLCASWRAINLKILLISSSIVCIATLALVPLGAVLGSSEWRTQMLEENILVEPVAPNHAKGLLLIIHRDELTPKAKFRFRNVCLQNSQALLWCRQVPSKQVLSTVADFNIAPMSFVAAKEEASELWEAWRSGKTAEHRVLICDPSYIPKIPKTGTEHGPLCLQLARFGIFNDPIVLEAYEKDTGQAPVRVGTISAAWWSQPQKVLDVHINTYIWKHEP